jgi:hypothetical protein
MNFFGVAKWLAAADILPWRASWDVLTKLVGGEIDALPLTKRSVVEALAPWTQPFHLRFQSLDAFIALGQHRRDVRGLEARVSPIDSPSETEFAQGRMIVGTAAERPVILALALLDRDIVDTGDAKPHQAVLVEFPILVAVAAEPKPAIIVPFIGEAHGYAVRMEGPHFLDQPVIELAVPLARQERFDGLAPLEEFRAVTPAAVDRVGERDARGRAYSMRPRPCVSFARRSRQ